MYTALAVLERAHRGSVEGQYFDALFGVREFHPLLGRIDVALRGWAVEYGVLRRRPAPTRLRLGGVTLDTLPDQQVALERMLEQGITVMVDADDRARLGLDRRPLLAGIQELAGAQLAARWADYDGVWFL